MHFLGTVQDNVNAVQMVYEIARASDGQSVAQHSFTVAGSLTGTAFDQVIDELTSGNSVLQDEEVYNLILTSTDVAGNAQRTRFQFFVPGDRRVVDDDPWISPTNPNDPPTDPRTPIPGVTPTAGNLSSWGYVGSGGSWGYYGGSGSGGGWTPGYDGQLTPEGKADHRGLTGTGYEYEYAESVDAIVRQAVDLISTSPATIHQKAALQNRQNILLAIGDRLNTLIQADGNFTNDQALIDQMRPAMEGLFADAYDPNGYRAGVYDTFVPWGGAWLAQELVQDGRSVREQVFQATLLEVVTETFATRQIAMSQAQQSALTAAVLELAKTYTWLNPNPETTVPTESEAFGFLDLLWRLQVPDANGQFKGNGDITAALGQAITQLGQLLEGVNDPVRAIQFINNLMQAASTVPSLKNDLKDTQFLREFIEFGFEFVRSNPTVNQTAPDAAVQGFLDRLWRGDTQQVKQAQGGLSAFFAGMDTEAEKIKGLDFAVNLLNAAELLQGEGLETQKYDPVFLDALVGLGGTYAALNSSNAKTEIQTLSGFFLNTLWSSHGTQDVQQGKQELNDFFTIFDNDFNTPHNRLEAMRLQNKALETIDESPEIWSNLKDVFFITPSFIQEGLTNDGQYLPNLPAKIVAANPLSSEPNVFTGLPPWLPRGSFESLDSESNGEFLYAELQRLWAINLIKNHAPFISQMAAEYNVTSDAIAGAILWEATENPYSVIRHAFPGGIPNGTSVGIPGKIHVTKDTDVSVIIEREGRVPALAKNTWQERAKRLTSPFWAIRYIAAIMDRSAEIYERTAREAAKDDVAQKRPPRPVFNIRDDAGVLTTLYQGGKDQDRADTFEKRRLAWFNEKKVWNDIPNDRFTHDGKPLEPPLPLLPKAEKMGPWVSSYRWWIRAYLLQPNGCPSRGYLPDSPLGSPPPGVPPAQSIPIPTKYLNQNLDPDQRA
ncbi:hypothetical protein ACN4EK_31280 [Pantanalinema rosaneae CENA516]|uniref:hypothetical protein n=1 Tax=Pantanalinema rosaneae TaxID=1620701 RepID=UPI003D6FCBD6